ncbi:hypothetical protein JAAARDRAFT_708451 [Jaapia argillacea MUCL 33604]|uniref:Zincin n=1 Tax=Jaapia argillacea MUCL 33604 TaxID=933084 RepID=A0A067QAY4_9AGAM|nr:hypothetical protein JAAARDRAFT_708451 [Jaapia argillacea MUCL 33604]
MDEDRLDNIGEEPLLRIARTIRRLVRGESTDIGAKDEDVRGKKVDSEKKKRDGLTAAVAYLHSRGIGALFDFDIDGDVGVDPNHMTLWFSQPSLGLPSKEYYEEESITELYRSVLERLLVSTSDPDAINSEELEELTESHVPSAKFTHARVHKMKFWPPWPWPPWGGDEDGGGDDGGGGGGGGGKDKLNRTERAKVESKKVLEFEKKVAAASLDLDILYQDPYATYNPIPLSNLTSALPQIDFPAYFSTFAPRAFPSRLIITYPSYPSSLSTILNSTSTSTIEAYLTIRAALSLAQNLGTSTESWKAVRTMEEKLRGIKKGAVGERGEFCVGKVESALGFASGRYFVNETFGGESREKGTKVITDIVEAFKASLRNLKWMDKESADAAAQKADAIRVKVGFPLFPDTRRASSIAGYYNRVAIDEHTFFDNIVSAHTNEQIWKWMKLDRRRNMDEWEMYASTVNAYFNPPANEIVFPAGILQPPFFAQDWPGYMAYGSFGMVAAHELTHAFDSAGRMYNQQGKLEQWWTNATSQGFQVLQDCIVKQYSAYTIDDGKGGKVHVNVSLASTSGENIGDTGLIQAYRAWKAQYHASYDDGNEYILPGLSYTREQLFFISFARAWAQNIKPESAVQRVRTDPHSPNRYRVDGTVYNVPEFAKAFKCSPKAKLNPPREKQCLLW